MTNQNDNVNYPDPAKGFMRFEVVVTVSAADMERYPDTEAFVRKALTATAEGYGDNVKVERVWR